MIYKNPCEWLTGNVIAYFLCVLCEMSLWEKQSTVSSSGWFGLHSTGQGSWEVRWKTAGELGSCLLGAGVAGLPAERDREGAKFRPAHGIVQCDAQDVPGPYLGERTQ